MNWCGGVTEGTAWKSLIFEKQCTWLVFRRTPNNQALLSPTRQPSAFMHPLCHQQCNTFVEFVLVCSLLALHSRLSEFKLSTAPAVVHTQASVQFTGDVIENIQAVHELWHVLRFSASELVQLR